MATAPRCIRSDGRSWRCKRSAMEGSGGYCEAHIRRKGQGKLGVEGSGGRGPVGPRKSRRLSLKKMKGGFKGDVRSVQEEIMELGAGDLKGNNVEKVYVRRPKVVSVVGLTPEKVYARRRKRDNSEISEEKESAGDATVAPFSAPMSPNIGESAHQQSLFTQTQQDFNIDLPAPSASTSSMAIKKCDGTQSKNADTRLGNLDIGSEVKAQKAKQVSKSIDEFSVSKCAALLNNMTGFTPEELVKASKLFIKSFNREMFLSLKDELRRVWLRSQLSD